MTGVPYAGDLFGRTREMEEQQALGILRRGPFPELAWARAGRCALCMDEIEHGRAPECECAG